MTLRRTVSSSFRPVPSRLRCMHSPKVLFEHMKRKPGWTTGDAAGAVATGGGGCEERDRAAGRVVHFGAAEERVGVG